MPDEIATTSSPSAPSESSSSSIPTLAQAFAADRAAASPPAPTGSPAPASPTQPASGSSSPATPAVAANPQANPAAPSSEPDEPPPPAFLLNRTPDGTTPYRPAPPTAPDFSNPAVQEAFRIQKQVQEATLQQEAIRLGATPQQAQQVVQMLNAQQQIQNQRAALENHPVTRQIAAEQIAAPYARWGVKATDILSAPDPQSMQYAAYTLAQANKAANNTSKASTLTQRAASGNDTFESGQSAGQSSTVDYMKTSGLSLMKRALSQQR